MKNKYVYLIRVKHRFDDGSSNDFEYVLRVYSSLRRALDCLESYRTLYVDAFSRSGYDVNHWVDYQKDGYHSYMNIKKGSELESFILSREILF